MTCLSQDQTLRPWSGALNLPAALLPEYVHVQGMHVSVDGSVCVSVYKVRTYK